MIIEKLINYTGTLVAKIILVGMAIMIIFPLIWMGVSAFKPSMEFFAYPPKILPSNWTLTQFQEVFSRIPILGYLKNTVIFSVVVMFANLLFCSMAGYAFGRIQFKGKNILFTLCLMTMMIPFQIIIVPMYMELHFFGMLDSWAGLLIPRFANAFGIFLLRGFFAGLPKDLEEAARVDGMHEFGIFFRIMLPLCKPVMITLAVLTINANWNSLLWPLIVTSSDTMKTLTYGLASFVGPNTVEYGPAFAGALISVIPMFILYVVAQKYFVKSIARSGMKV